MTITAEQITTKRPAKKASDPFGGAIPMVLVALAMTGIGFWRTFFSKLGHVDAVHMMHGVVMTGWLVLVMTQALLIRNRKFKLHRVIGWGSTVLFAVMIVTSWYMVALMLSGKTGLPFAFAKPFAYSDLVTLPLLIILYSAAILLRKDRHVHSRLVTTTVLVAFVPAVARVFNLIWTGPVGLLFAMHPTYIFVLAILGIAIFADWRNKRLRWPLPFAFVWFAVVYASFFPGFASQWFDHVARAVGATV
jgi:hypothetical protein